MANKRIIIAFTKKSVYTEAPFWKDKSFFIRGNNFCFIDCNGHFQNFSASNFIELENEGILLVHDGWKGENALENLNFEDMFKAINEKINKDHTVFIWYHTPTEGVMENYVETYLKDLGIEAINTSSHIIGTIHEIYTHIIPFSKKEISLDEILEKCYSSKTRQDAFEKNTESLLQNLFGLTYKEGILVNDKNAKEFIVNRNRFIQKYQKQ